MSGCYNGLQAIPKEKVGEHVAFLHCNADTLNLVLLDSASVAFSVISLVNDLAKLWGYGIIKTNGTPYEALYDLVRKTQGIHEFFETVQREENARKILFPEETYYCSLAFTRVESKGLPFLLRLHFKCPGYRCVRLFNF